MQASAPPHGFLQKIMPHPNLTSRYEIVRLYGKIDHAMSQHTQYYEKLAAAFARGKLHNHSVRERHPALFTTALEELAEEEQRELIGLGLQQGLRLHRFKRTMDLPRVRKVLGILRGLQPATLLDIGSGRGAFLWPLLDAFPYLPVTCIDVLDYRVADIQAMHEGGLHQLNALHTDVTELAFPTGQFEVVTMLEVLEHIAETDKALAEICRVARRFIILSVPSKEDDNPEHIHLFNEQSLRQRLQQQGVSHVSFDYVPGHIIAIARIYEHV
jgi:2-polyprenyl-3-methyl-5-hydroxy-6-metoxy-1,4-benzoquinol methylase